MTDDEALRALLGIDDSGAPTAQARQAVALIRHPHTPWTFSELAEDRLGALLVGPLALNLRGTAWQDLLANELIGGEPTGPDLPLAERARRAGTGIGRLVAVLSPLIDLFDDPTLPFTNFAPAHTEILFPALYEHAELWSNAFNEYAVSADRDLAERRATERVLESLTDPDLEVDVAAHLVGQFREAAILLASGRAPQLLDGLRARDVPLEGWPAWTGAVADRLAAAPRPTIQAVAALDDEGDAELPRRLRCGYRYWHVWGTYSQLYDALLTTAPALAERMRGYLYIGRETGQELIPLPGISELPLNGWELKTLFPELTNLMAVPELESFARARIPSSAGLSAVLGEIAELQALAADSPVPLADLSAGLLQLAADPDLDPEP